MDYAMVYLVNRNILGTNIPTIYDAHNTRGLTVPYQCPIEKVMNVPTDE